MWKLPNGDQSIILILRFYLRADNGVPDGYSCSFATADKVIRSIARKSSPLCMPDFGAKGKQRTFIQDQFLWQNLPSCYFIFLYFDRWYYWAISEVAHSHFLFLPYFFFETGGWKTLYISCSQGTACPKCQPSHSSHSVWLTACDGFIAPRNGIMMHSWLCFPTLVIRVFNIATQKEIKGVARLFVSPAARGTRAMTIQINSWIIHF